MTDNFDHRDFSEQSWADVEASISERFGQTFLPAFVSTLLLRGISKTSLRAAHGMDGLFIAVGRVPRPGEACLRLTPFNDGKIRFTYLMSGDPDWTHDYAPSEAEAAFDRFLVRAGWFPRSHPFFG